MKKKSILLFSISLIFLFSACTTADESKAQDTMTPIPTQAVTDAPTASPLLITEAEYIQMAKGGALNASLGKAIPQTTYFLRPAQAPESTDACIFITPLGYEFSYTPTDSSRYPNDAVLFVSDKEYDISTPLINALKEVHPEIVESELTHVTDNELEHYVDTQVNSETGQTETYVYFIFKNHFVCFTILADVSDDYLGYCNLKVIYF